MNLSRIGKFLTCLGVLFMLVGFGWFLILGLERGQAPVRDQEAFQKRLDQDHGRGDVQYTNADRAFQKSAYDNQMAQWPISYSVAMLGCVMLIVGFPLWAIFRKPFSSQPEVIDRVLHEMKAEQVASGTFVEQVVDEGWRPAITGVVACIVVAALLQFAIIRYEAVLPCSLLYQLMCSLFVAGVGGLVTISAFSLQTKLRRSATLISIVLTAVFCGLIFGRSVPTETMRTAIGAPAAIMTAAMVLTIWLLANFLAYFYRSAEIKDWLNIDLSKWRVPIMAVALSLFGIDILAPVLTTPSTASQFVVFLVALHLLSGAQLFVFAILCGFTRFTKWKILPISIGAYVLLSHSLIISLVPSWGGAQHGLVSWSIATFVFDYLILLPYGLWVGTRRKVRTA